MHTDERVWGSINVTTFNVTIFNVMYLGVSDSWCDAEDIL